jgi:hypothetical protein
MQKHLEKSINLIGSYFFSLLSIFTCQKKEGDSHMMCLNGHDLFKVMKAISDR